MAEANFDIQKLIAESKETLLNPKQYFSTMAKEGGLVEPIIKAVIYGAIAGVFSFLWLLIGLHGYGMGFGSGGAVMALILTPIFAIVGLFIGAVILLVLSAICGGNTNFEANIRVTAACMVLYPIQSLLGFLTGVNIWLGLLVGLVVGAYGLWLLFIALVNALAGKEATAKIVCIVLAVIMALMLYSSYSAYRNMSRFMGSAKMMEEMTEEEAQKAAAEMVKKMMEEAQKKE